MAPFFSSSPQATNSDATELSPITNWSPVNSSQPLLHPSKSAYTLSPSSNGREKDEAPDPIEIAGWRNYPVGFQEFNPATTPVGMYNEQLKAQTGTLFSDELNVHIMDIMVATGAPVCYTRRYERDVDIDYLLVKQTYNHPRMRIISIHSRNTMMPLKITGSAMRKILTRYRVSPSFLSVLFSFGAEPHLTETGNSNVSNTLHRNGSREICYLTRYAEKNHRSPSTPWSVRQTGVYHAHNPHADFDLFILLHPTPSSVFETQLIGLTGSVLDDFVANPYMVHLLAFSSYLGNWRWYFRYLGEDFRRKNDDAFALDLQTSVATASTFDMVQGLRHLFDTTISLSAFCKADLSNLRALNDVEEAGFESLSLIRKLSEELDGYQESLSALSKRIQNAIDLLAYWLDLRNQDTAAEVNHHLLHLQRETVDDSAVVKGITFLSLIYLPGHFVATVFGMNFFTFDGEARRINISDDFWKFVVTWIPLTLLTFLGYGLIMLRKKKTPKKEKEMWRAVSPGLTLKTLNTQASV